MNQRRDPRKERQIQGLRAMHRRSTDTNAEMAAELRMLRIENRRLRTDDVTKLYVRSEGRVALGRVVGSAMKTGTDVSLAFFDLVKFKKLNDRYGHDIGDIALRVVGDLLKSQTRAGEDLPYIAYRHGGDEMVVILPNTSAEGAAAFIRRVSAALEGKSAELQETLGIPEILISAGSKTLNGADIRSVKDGVKELLSGADKSMYKNKRSGKVSWALLEALGKLKRKGLGRSAQDM